MDDRDQRFDRLGADEIASAGTGSHGGQDDLHRFDDEIEHSLHRIRRAVDAILKPQNQAPRPAPAVDERAPVVPPVIEAEAVEIEREAPRAFVEEPTPRPADRGPEAPAAKASEARERPRPRRG